MQLGFLQSFDNPKWLNGQYFPSKVGGKPVWIDPEFIPHSTELVCKNCHTELVFILQFYAPLKTNSDSWHRMLYLFCCPNNSCVTAFPERSYLVLRSQLPSENPYYVECDESNDEDFELENENHPKTIYRKAHETKCCIICGKKAVYSLTCKEQFFCSPIHRNLFLNFGCKFNGDEDLLSFDSSCSNVLILPEFEIVTELEFDVKRSVMQQDMNKFLISNNTYPDSEFDEFDFTESKVDPVLLKFQNVISYDSEQVLRYIDDGSKEPLWTHSRGVLESKDVPACNLCGSDRVFELQILAQLIYCLQIESKNTIKNFFENVDWGTLVIYTCKNSCKIPIQECLGKYNMEFLYQQPSVEMTERL